MMVWPLKAAFILHLVDTTILNSGRTFLCVTVCQKALLNELILQFLSVKRTILESDLCLQVLISRLQLEFMMLLPDTKRQ